MKKLTKERVSGKLIGAIKTIRFSLSPHSETTTPLFIMGYGRSGSSMLLRIFERDLRLQTYGENHPAVASDYMINYERLAKTMKDARARVIVLKPILNSFEVGRLLTDFPDGVVIWLVRNCQDVVSSALKKFGSVVADYLQEFVERGTGENWLAKTMPHELRQEIRSAVADQPLTQNDWMALVWWAVNSIVIREKLADRTNVRLIRYEDLVQAPERVLTDIYKAISQKYDPSLGKYIHARSVGKGKMVALSPRVFELCSRLEQDIAHLFVK